MQRLHSRSNVSTFRFSVFIGDRMLKIMPGFETKPLTITIVGSNDNDSRIFPHNVMACFTAVRVRNSPLMFLQTCAKLTFCMTQIYFLAITA